MKPLQSATVAFKCGSIATSATTSKRSRDGRATRTTSSCYYLFMLIICQILSFVPNRASGSQTFYSNRHKLYHRNCYYKYSDCQQHKFLQNKRPWIPCSSLLLLHSKAFIQCAHQQASQHHCQQQQEQQYIQQQQNQYNQQKQQKNQQQLQNHLVNVLQQLRAGSSYGNYDEQQQYGYRQQTPPYNDDRYNQEQQRRKSGNSGESGYYGGGEEEEEEDDYYDEYYDERGLKRQSSPYSQRGSSATGSGAASAVLDALPVLSSMTSLIQNGNRQIGLPLLAAGACLTLLGMSLFFNSTLMRLGNICLIAGIPVTLGPTRTAKYFLQPTKTRATACLATGIFFVVIVGYPILGIALEIFGLLNLFGNMFPVIFAIAKQMPVIGPILSGNFGNDNSGGGRGNSNRGSSKRGGRQDDYYDNYYEEDDRYYGGGGERGRDGGGPEDDRYYDDRYERQGGGGGDRFY